MPQIITKDGVIYCQTKVNYSSEVMKNMKSGGYKIKTIDALPVEDNKCKTASKGDTYK